MPYFIRRKRLTKTRFQVVSYDKKTNKQRIHAKNTTLAKATRQVRLLRSLEHKSTTF